MVRKLLGHAHIPRRWAAPLNDFHRQHLNPYVNYHRPCLFPVTVTDRKGKQRKRYPYESLMTPYEKLKSLPDAKSYLKPDLSFEILDQIAYDISDNAAADALQQARRDLFTTIHEQEYKRAWDRGGISLLQAHSTIGKYYPVSRHNRRIIMPDNRRKTVPVAKHYRRPPKRK